MKQKIVFLSSLVMISITFWGCQGGLFSSTTAVDYNEIDREDNAENSELSDLIEPYDQKLSAEMNQVIGTLTKGMAKDRPEGLLSNFIADLVFTEVQKLEGYTPDMCLLNHGGLRAPLPEGDIKVKDIYELMPFENEVVMLELTADKLQEIAIYLNYSGGEPISGATVLLSENPELKLLSEEIKPEETYMVITSDYLAKGGDKMNFFIDPVSYHKTGIKLRDMIMNYFHNKTASGEAINAELDGRISTK